MEYKDSIKLKKKYVILQCLIMSEWKKKKLIVVNSLIIGVEDCFEYFHNLDNHLRTYHTLRDKYNKRIVYYKK